MNSRAAEAFVVLDDRVDRDVVEMVMSSSHGLVVHDYVDLNEFSISHDGAGDVMIVACVDFTPELAEYVRTAHRAHPARPLVVLCARGSNGFIADAIAAGAEDVLVLPPDGDLASARAASEHVVLAVHKAIARRRGAPGTAAGKGGAMICMLGLKGGSGKTLTATNLAVALAYGGASVVIVDLDLQFGDVGLALGLSPERTIYDLVRSGGSMDADKLADFLVVHPSGVRALLAPVRPDQASVVTPQFLKDLFPLLREMHDFVIVDTPPNFTPEVIAAVDSSSDVCMVSMLDSLALKNSKLGMETLELMDYPGPIRVVLNRADSRVGISAEDVVAIMGRAPDVLVPSDRNITRAINQGEPMVALHKRSEAARSYHALGDLYLSQHRPGRAKAKRRRLVGRRRHV